MPSKLGQNDIDVQVTDTGVEEQIRLLQNMPEKMTEYLTKAVKQGNTIMKASEKPRVKRFTGSTADSITSKVKLGTFAGSVTGITGPSKNQSYIFRFMQTGRAAGAKMPRVDDRLIGWVEEKFGVTGKEAKQRAFGLAKSIQDKGIKGVQVARPVLESNKNAVLMLLQAAVNKITEAMKVNG